ncbi:MAG: DUF1440 domain-containing protein [Dysgonamonadaceae bacterium]
MSYGRDITTKADIAKGTILAGFLSAIVKFGWEVPFPPRTPARDVTNPPQELLQQLGIPEKITHLTYIYNDNARPFVSFIVHFGFAFFFSWLYLWLAKRTRVITWGAGALYGIAIYVLFHIIIMPLMGTVPMPWDQPWEEHISELFGHIVWAWSIELVRVYIQKKSRAVY